MKKEYEQHTSKFSRNYLAMESCCDTETSTDKTRAHEACRKDSMKVTCVWIMQIQWLVTIGSNNNVEGTAIPDTHLYM